MSVTFSFSSHFLRKRERVAAISVFSLKGAVEQTCPWLEQAAIEQTRPHSYPARRNIEIQIARELGIQIDL
jgi:hypothetical protein